MAPKNREASESMHVRFTKRQLDAMKLLSEEDPLHPSISAMIRAAVDTVYVTPHIARTLGISREAAEAALKERQG